MTPRMTRYLTLGRVTIGALLVLLSASMAQAQAPPDAIRFRVALAATPTVFIETANMPLTAPTTTCDLAPGPPPVQSFPNPTRIRFVDPARPLRECEINMATFFGGLVLGTYGTPTAVFLAAGVESPRAASANSFTRAPVILPPLAPAGLHVQ